MHERLRRTGVHLPEGARREGELTLTTVTEHDPLAHERHLPAWDDDCDGISHRRRNGIHGVRARPRASGHPQTIDPRRGDAAVVDGDDLVRAVAAQPCAAVSPDRELDAGAPVQATVVPGHGLDRDVDVEAGQPGELLAHHVGLEQALPRERHVLEVAPTAAARPRPRARRRDAVRRRRDHRDGIRPHETLPGTRLGHPGEHPLPGHGVPHEQHLPLVAGDAVATVGDRRDVDLDLVPDGEAARVRGFASSHQPSPRRTSPATGPSRRSSMPSDDASCHGTDDTMTPGVNSRRERSRRALWLCRICSHQCPTTYCGM